MFIAKVVGNLWATRKHKCLQGLKLLLICQIDPFTKKIISEPIMAVDKKIDAGLGNIVLVMDEGNSARQILENPCACVRTIICGIVDCVSSKSKTVKFH